MVQYRGHQNGTKSPEATLLSGTLLEIVLSLREAGPTWRVEALRRTVSCDAQHTWQRYREWPKPIVSSF